MLGGGCEGVGETEVAYRVDVAAEDVEEAWDGLVVHDQKRSHVPGRKRNKAPVYRRGIRAVWDFL